MRWGRLSTVEKAEVADKWTVSGKPGERSPLGARRVDEGGIEVDSEDMALLRT